MLNISPNPEIYSIQNSTMIDSTQSLPRIAIANQLPKILPFTNSMQLPTTVTYVNFPTTTNGRIVSTLASLPRIFPKPIESLVHTQAVHVKTESKEEGDFLTDSKRKE